MVSKKQLREENERLVRENEALIKNLAAQARSRSTGGIVITSGTDIDGTIRPTWPDAERLKTALAGIGRDLEAASRIRHPVTSTQEGVDDAHLRLDSHWNVLTERLASIKRLQRRVTATNVQVNRLRVGFRMLRGIQRSQSERLSRLWNSVHRLSQQIHSLDRAQIRCDEVVRDLDQRLKGVEAGLLGAGKFFIPPTMEFTQVTHEPSSAGAWHTPSPLKFVGSHDVSAGQEPVEPAWDGIHGLKVDSGIWTCSCGRGEAGPQADHRLSAHLHKAAKDAGRPVGVVIRP